MVLLYESKIHAHSEGGIPYALQMAPLIGGDFAQSGKGAQENQETRRCALCLEIGSLVLNISCASPLGTDMVLFAFFASLREISFSGAGSQGVGVGPEGV